MTVGFGSSAAKRYFGYVLVVSQKVIPKQSFELSEVAWALQAQRQSDLPRQVCVDKSHAVGDRVVHSVHDTFRAECWHKVLSS